MSNKKPDNKNPVNYWMKSVKWLDFIIIRSTMNVTTAIVQLYKKNYSVS